MPARSVAVSDATPRRRAADSGAVETGDMLARLGEVIRELRLDPARMRRNLDLGGEPELGAAGLCNRSPVTPRDTGHLQTSDRDTPSTQ